MACDEPVPSQESIWVEMAAVIAKLSRCTRKQVGAIVVRNGQPISWGHNGPQDESSIPFHCPRGSLSYAEQPANIGYDGPNGCIELHAEELALSRATVSPRGATMYVNTEPCSRCQYAMRVCGVDWVVLGIRG